MSNLTIQDIVRVSATISPRGALRRDFGRTLFLTTDDTLDTGAGRVEVFNDFRAISTRFPVGSEPYAAGNIYFQQEPFPKNLLVGRWFENAASAILRGGTVAALANITAVNDGSLQINGEDVTGLDFSGDSSYTDVASTLQTALQAATDPGITDATVTFDAVGQRFIVDSVTTGASITMTVASDAASGTAVAGLLGLSATAGATAFNGADAETIQEALAAVFALNSGFYHITLDKTITDTDDILAVNSWVAAQTFLFSAGSVDPTVANTGENSSAFAQLATLQTDRAYGTWSRTDDYKAVSAAGRLSSWLPSQRNSTFTMKFKSLPGTTVDNINDTIKTELNRKRVNLFADRDGTHIYEEGTTFSPDAFIDVRLFVDWLVNALTVDLFNLLVQSPKLPQTDAGNGAVNNTIERVLIQGVNNGGIAPGQLSPALTLDVQQSTGNMDFDGYLPKGYLIFIPSYVEQSQSDRAQRFGSPPKIWVKGSGAVHFLNVGLTFEN